MTAPDEDYDPLDELSLDQLRAELIFLSRAADGYPKLYPRRRARLRKAIAEREMGAHRR